MNKKSQKLRHGQHYEEAIVAVSFHFMQPAEAEMLKICTMNPLNLILPAFQNMG